MKQHRNLSIWLIACYIYYNFEKYNGYRLLSDYEFDELSKELSSTWDSWDHIHKHLITKDNLASMTNVGIKEWPNIVKSCANELYERYKETGECRCD